ncbi:unnamed protein product, partial [Ectocarpus sp. 13 AM-2016]
DRAGKKCWTRRQCRGWRRESHSDECKKNLTEAELLEGPPKFWERLRLSQPRRRRV